MTISISIYLSIYNSFEFLAQYSKFKEAMISASFFDQPLLTHTAMLFSKLLPTKLRPRSRSLSKKNQVKSLSVTCHPVISMSFYLSKINVAVLYEYKLCSM
jgi:hypothetical protein